MTNEQLKQWRTDLGLSDSGMAEYLGIPVYTWVKWQNGTRKLDAASVRLCEVLRSVRINAPDLHASFMPDRAIRGVSIEDKGLVAVKYRGASKRLKSDPEVPATPPPSEIPSWMAAGA